ncbi:MAG: hypothetical protein V1818_02395 [Candidatus Aenigmatarchaeota archaeon]
MVDGLIPNYKERIPILAKGIMYEVVARTLEDAKTPTEGLKTANEILSKVSRGTRKEIKRDVLKPYEQRHSL